jgi:hypothetical protein
VVKLAIGSSGVSRSLIRLKVDGSPSPGRAQLGQGARFACWRRSQAASSSLFRVQRIDKHDTTAILKSAVWAQFDQLQVLVTFDDLGAWIATRNY